MTPDPRLEAWLTTATRQLASHSAAQVRAEIAEHYQSALASGTTPEDAVAALGDPRSANRKYRRVLLTEQEARLAVAYAAIDAQPPAKAQARRNPGKSSSRLRRWLGWLSVPALLFLIPDPGSWAFVPMWVLNFVDYFFPSSSPLRTRISLGVSALTVLWILWPVLQALRPLFVVLAIPAALIAVVVAALFGSQHVRQRGLNRKLAGKDLKSLILGPPPTQTPTFLCCAGPMAAILMLTFAAISTLFQPLLGGTLLAACAFCFLVPLLVSIDTSEQIRLFRQLKWTAIVLAAIAVYFLRSHIPEGAGVEFDAALAFAGIFMLAVIEIGRARYRRKLPVEQWPDWLYFEGPR